MLVRNCKSEEDWKNKYFSTKQVQNMFEKAQIESVQLSNFELSLRILGNEFVAIKIGSTKRLKSSVKTKQFITQF